MNIKEEYIIKIKEELETLGEKLNKINTLEKEINILQEDDFICSGIDFNKMGFKTSRSSTGLGEIIENREMKIDINKAEIDHIKKKYDFRLFSLYLNSLDPIERDVIEYKYLNKDNLSKTFEKISKKIKYSEATVRRKHNKAAKELAYLRYGEIAIA